MRLNKFTLLYMFAVLAILPHETGFAASEALYTFPPVRSTILTPDARAIPTSVSESPYYLPYTMTRAYGFADMNLDGRTDIIVAPNFFRTGPVLPIRILLQQPSGNFIDATAQVIDGPIPVTAVVNDVLVADFNEDGRPDIFFIDQGLEDTPPSYYGATNKLLLSQPNGRYVDATSNITPNPLGFNHNGVVADFNHDQHLDVLITDLGTAVSQAVGVYVLLGNGKGRFIRSTDRLPAAVRYSTYSEMSAVPDFQSPYGSTLADLDGDGLLDLITATSEFLRTNETHNIRFYRQQPGGTFSEAARWQVPQGLSFSNWGIWRPAAGDINGDGRLDLAIFWEITNHAHVGILRNNGNFSFTDITVQALGTYDLSGSSVNGQRRLVGTVELTDINDDRLADLVVRSYGERLEDLATSSFAFISDGQGAFTPWQPQIVQDQTSPAHFQSQLACQWCAYLPFFIPGKLGSHDLLLVDHQSTGAPVTGQSTAIHTYLLRDASPTEAQSNCLFNWGEDNYPTLFAPKRPLSQIEAPYYYRFYAQTNNYLGVSSFDYHLYFLTGGQLQDLGLASVWSGAAGCQ